MAKPRRLAAGDTPLRLSRKLNTTPPPSQQQRIPLLSKEVFLPNSLFILLRLEFQVAPMGSLSVFQFVACHFGESKET